MIITTLILTTALSLVNPFYTKPMQVVENKACCVLDDGQDVWEMDRDDRLTEGQTITVLMYNNNTTNTHIDDVIITYIH